MPATLQPEARLADAALRILARKSWADVTLAEVARSAKLPLAKLQELAPAKPALLGLMLERIGEKTAKRYRPDRGGTNRDKLFDVGMAWFDVLGPHKPAIRALYEGIKHDPLLLVVQRTQCMAAAQWLMTLAEADTGSGLAFRAAAYAFMLGRAIPVWLDDDDDLTRTMARLDSDLNRQASVLGNL